MNPKTNPELDWLHIGSGLYAARDPHSWLQQLWLAIERNGKWHMVGVGIDTLTTAMHLLRRTFPWEADLDRYPEPKDLRK